MTTMNELQRFLACMEYQPVDRVPFWSWGGWPETIERWKREGYDPARFEPASLCDGRTGAGHWFFPNPPFERKVIQEDAEHIVYVNHEGILMKEMKNNPWSSMPQFLKFPVETRQEFHAFWKERMQPDLTQRIGPDWKEQLRKERARPMPCIVISDRWGGFFGPLRNLLGVENLCMLFHDDPAFVEEMMDANADLIIAVMSQVLDVVAVDAFGFWEDMAYNHGPLISPDMARRYMLPRYKRVTEFLRGRGVKYVGLDSDGQMDCLIPVWMDAGLNFLYPFEVQAGMDVLAVRRKHGKTLRIWGGVDKRALRDGPEAIDKELQRLQPLIREGGYIPHTDHSCPPDISYGNYCYYMRRLAEVCGVPQAQIPAPVEGN
jgi:uroporphyrinogen-III decarboxylase